MNVLYVFSEDDKYGSAQSSIELILKIKKEQPNITPIVITPQKNNITKICNRNTIENYSIKYHSCAHNIEKSLRSKIGVIKHFVLYKIYNPLAIKKITKITKNKNISIVHTVNSEIDIGNKIAKKIKAKSIIHLREVGILNKNKIFFRNKYPLLLNRETDLFFSVSNYVGKIWKEKGITKKIITIYDETPKIMFKKTKSKKEKIRIVNIGSIGNIKNQLELVESIKILPTEIKNKIEVDIIGEGSKNYLKKIKKIIKTNNLKNIFNIKGYDPEIKTKLEQYDIGVICTKHEGFGRTTMEYMTSGLIVIASNDGANAELIRNKENGFLYEPENPEDLAKKIKFVLRNIKTQQNIKKQAKERSKQINKKAKQGYNDIYKYYQVAILSKSKKC